jgi:hypothetical protein
MTPDEACEELEKGLMVSDEQGFEAYPGALLDRGRAPNGDRYVFLTSGGIVQEGEAFAGWFSTEDGAVSAWLREAWNYAEDCGGSDLYWHSRPALFDVDFVAVNQTEMIGVPMLRGNIALTLYSVVARLVVSRKKEQA